MKHIKWILKLKKLYLKTSLGQWDLKWTRKFKRWLTDSPICLWYCWACGTRINHETFNQGGGDYIPCLQKDDMGYIRYEDGRPEWSNEQCN